MATHITLKYFLSNFSFSHEVLFIHSGKKNTYAVSSVYSELSTKEGGKEETKVKHSNNSHPTSAARAACLCPT